MKQPQKITKIQLKSSQNEGLIVFGIVSHEADYKLSLILNQIIGISLKQDTPITISDDFGNVHFFSRFTTSAYAPDNIVYTLTFNRSGSFFLLKKLKNIDYLFYINNYSGDSDLESKIFTTLRKIENVNAVLPIDIKTLNDKNTSYLIQ